MRTKKTFASYREPFIAKTDLIGFQQKSYEDFLHKGLEKLFKEFFPIVDTNERFSIEFVSWSIGEPSLTPKEAKHQLTDYSAPFKATIRLVNKVTGTTKEEEVLFVDIPIITPHSSFIINGVERVIVSQLVRADGVRFFQEMRLKGQGTFGAEVRPMKGHGVWVVFESDLNGRVVVRIDQSVRKLPVTTFIRAFGPQTQAEVLRLFEDDDKALQAIKDTFAIDEAQVMDDVWLNIYRTVRSGEPINTLKAKEVIEGKFSPQWYDLSQMGRVNLNRRFNRSLDAKSLQERHLTLEDIVCIVKEIVRLNNDPGAVEDDIDNLTTRRVRPVGELIREHVRTGVVRMRKNTKDRMVTTDPTMLQNPTDILNLRIFKTTVQSFFSTNQLSQTLKQHNILDEIEHVRTLSALGRGGLMREHAGIAVRDIHPSHYGRICPVHSSEGANIGLVLHMSLYARFNEYGLLEVPYRKVVNGVLTDKVDYLTADQEEVCYVAPATIEVDEKGAITTPQVPVRHKGVFKHVTPENVSYVDVASGQMLSASTTLIPFILNNIPARAAFGSNIQRQAVPCLYPEAPLVATGYEELFARASGRMLIAEEAGEVVSIDATQITLKTDQGKKQYKLQLFVLTNAKTFSTHQRPSVRLGQKVKKGDILANTASTDDGQIALGKNLRVGFICNEGANYEDAIVISRRLIENDTLTSIEAEEFSVDVRETKIGPEVSTADIPNVSEYRLRNLDPDGIARVGSDVYPGDILVGKVTPRGETHLSAEERLLQSIFGDKAKDMKDTSLTLPAGKTGRVISVQIRNREDGYTLDSGVIKQVRITIAVLRVIQEGDKLANRHGNKGVISRVLPVEDMPFDENGEPLDVLLTPLGVPSRQNLGQILELHLGLVAESLNYQAVIPPFTSISEEELRGEMEKAGFPKTGKITLYDGKTGQAFNAPIAIGWMYIMKLEHMVDDKIHMRSIGPYSLVSQQPLGGRSRRGGQRMGEMEVWALLGHGAAYTLREMLTIKSDDINGRSSAYNAIIRGEPITQSGIPASFNVLLYYLRGLGLDAQFVDSEKEEE